MVTMALSSRMVFKVDEVEQNIRTDQEHLIFNCRGCWESQEIGISAATEALIAEVCFLSDSGELVSSGVFNVEFRVLTTVHWAAFTALNSHLAWSTSHFEFEVIVHVEHVEFIITEGARTSDDTNLFETTFDAVNSELTIMASTAIHWSLDHHEIE